MWRRYSRIQSCPVEDVISTSRCELCIHDIVSTSFTSMYYPVYIVDIAMWTMYTRYRVNIVYIYVLSCLHRQHRDVSNVYTISCQHRLHRYTIMLTSSTSRCERCIHKTVSTSFKSMYYRDYIVHIVDIAIHETRYDRQMMTGYRCWHDVDTISSTSRCRRC